MVRGNRCEPTNTEHAELGKEGETRGSWDAEGQSFQQSGQKRPSSKMQKQMRYSCDSKAQTLVGKERKRRLELLNLRCECCYRCALDPEELGELPQAIRRLS